MTVKYRLKFKDERKHGEDTIGVKIYHPVDDNGDYHRIMDVFINDDRILHLYDWDGETLDDFCYGNKLLNRIELDNVVSKMVHKYQDKFVFQSTGDDSSKEKYDEEIDIDLDIPLYHISDTNYEKYEDELYAATYSNFVPLAEFNNFTNTVIYVDEKPVKVGNLTILYNIVTDDIYYAIFDKDNKRIKVKMDWNILVDTLKSIFFWSGDKCEICLMDAIELLKWNDNYEKRKVEIINKSIRRKLETIFNHCRLFYYTRVDDYRKDNIRKLKDENRFIDIDAYNICKTYQDLQYPNLKDKLILGDGEHQFIFRFIDMYNKEEQIYGVPALLDSTVSGVTFYRRYIMQHITPDIIVTLKGEVFVKCKSDIYKTLRNTVKSDTELMTPFRCFRMVLSGNNTEKTVSERLFSFNEIYIDVNSSLIDANTIKDVVKDIDDELLHYVLTNIKKIVNESLDNITYLSNVYNNV